LPAPRSWSRSAGNVPQREPRGNGPGTGGGSEGPDGPLVDAYHSSAFQVFFDGSDRVEFVELSRSDEIEARYDGVPVLALPAWEAIEYMTTKAPFNPDDPELGFSYEFPSLETAIWRPEDDDEEPEGRTFMTIGVGRLGYFSGRVY